MMKLNNEWFLLLLCLVFFAVTYTVAYPQHALYADENAYLLLGQEILDGGYYEGMTDRAPMLPLMVSACRILGLDSFQIKFITPLIIGLLFISALFLLGKKFCKRPFIPVIVALSFPFFWKWAPFLLVDVLLGVFSTLSALYLYRALKGREGDITYSILFLSLAILTKASAVILIPIFLLYLFMRRRLSVLKHMPFLKGFVLFLLILVPAVILTILSSGGLGINLAFMTMDYFRLPTYYFLNLAMVPWSLLFLFGLYKTIGGRKYDDEGYIFSLLIFLIIFIFFNMLIWKEMRFLLFALPFFAVIVERGIASFSNKTAYIITSAFFVAGFVLSMLLLSTVSYVTWGDDILTRELLELPDDAVIAYDSLLVYTNCLYNHTIRVPANATAEWVRKSGADYLSISLYGELERGPDMSYYRPRIGPIDISLIETGNPKAILTWWPDYKFSSSLYQWAESSLQTYKVIQFQEQDVFIIYKLS